MLLLCNYMDEMHTADEARQMDRFWTLLASEHDQHAKRWRFGVVLAVMIAVLGYETQWTALRTGLAILLVGQIGVVAALMVRNAGIAKALREQTVLEQTVNLEWFGQEELFLVRLTRAENACRLIGFAALGYGTWFSTHSIGLTLAVGAVYPAVAYLGLTRASHRATIRRLRTIRDQVLLSEQQGQHRDR